MIRFAERHDLEDCLRMARNFHEKSPYSHLDFDESKCRELFQKYLEGDRTEILILLAESSKVFGMIIGLRGELPFSSVPVSTELAWWVDPEYRKSRDSLMLFKAYEEWSRRVGAKITQVAMLDDVTDLSGFYTKQGYTAAEKSYVRNN